jgi:hypothetical protein
LRRCLKNYQRHLLSVLFSGGSGFASSAVWIVAGILFVTGLIGFGVAARDESSASRARLGVDL